MTSFDVEWTRWTARLRQGLRRVPRLWWWLGGLGLAGLVSLELLTAGRTPPAAGTLLDGAGAAAPDPWAGGGLLVDVTLKLGLVIALIYGCLYLLRRWQTGTGLRAAKQLAVLETTRLTPRQAVHLIRAGDQVFLVGATDQQVSLLAQLEATPLTPDPAPASPASPRFGPALAQMLAADGRSDEGQR